jgi:tRNA(Ile)-lysidine synthase
MRGARPFAALEAAVARAVRPAAGEVLVAAASGGPDSTALAALLARTARAADARLVLAHVNHGIRPGAWQDEAVVLAVGAALGARVAVRALPAGPANEARLRDERYATLVAIAREASRGEPVRVFTAHHAEDQTETVLLALFRGAGPDGLTGMAPERPLADGVTLARPLLGIESAALRAYCAAGHLPIAVDPTNDDAALRRNALRRMLGELRGPFPHLDAAVARCATILREERSGEPRAALRARLRAELAVAAGDARDVSFERLDSVAHALERGRRGRHFLRRGVEVIVE